LHLTQLSHVMADTLV